MNGPRAQEDAERLALLHRADLLDAGTRAAFDGLVASVARATGCGFALISLVGGDRIWFKSRAWQETQVATPDQSLCHHALLSEGLLEVPDLRADPRFADNPRVVGGPRFRFYAGQPLRIEGHRVGTLCAFDDQPRRLTAADRELLANLAQAVSELLLSRRRLREAEDGRQRLLDFGRAGGDWMWESDAQHRYLWVSESFEARTGMRAAEQIGRPISDFVVLGADGQPAQPPQRYREVLDRHAPFARVLTAKPSPRGTLLLSRSAVPVLDTAGRFAGYRGTIRDVTRQLQTVARMRERDDRLGKLASQVPGIVFQYQWHPDGRSSYPYASERMREILGVEPPRDGNGGDPTVPARLLHPDDRAGFERGLSESARTLAPWLGEYRVLGRDGSVRWLDTFATPERLPDGSVLWHGFTADITARKASEAALRRREQQWQIAAQGARIGLAQLSLADGLLRLDAQARANHGLEASVESLSLEAWLATIDALDRDAAHAHVRRLLADGTPFEGRYRVQLSSGRVRWLEFVVRASYDAHGNIDGLLGTCRDVHHQQTAAQLERARLDAERASRAKSEFLSRLSHELRTPLNGILGFAQLMAIDREQPLSGRQAQRLASMQHAGSHLLGLINDVLEISRTGAADAGWEAGRVSVDGVIDSTLGLVEPLAQRRSIRLQRERVAGADESLAVLGETRRIEQVLMNLLSNAIKHSPPGSCVTVRVHGTTDAVRMAVSDQGHGIDASQMSRLFQPFERLDADKRQVDGVGLGLFIARQLAEAMGGRIEVASRVGVGSTFTLMLRRDRSVASEEPSAEAPSAAGAASDLAGAIEAPAEAAPARLRHIVYVEDESLNQLLFQEVVRGRSAWQLHLADDGAAGWRLAHELRPDVMLIDINLPDTNGLALVKRLRADARTQGLRCVALSADAMSDQIDAARRAGFDDYWTKPIDVAQVLGQLEQMLADPGLPASAPDRAA